MRNSTQDRNCQTTAMSSFQDSSQSDILYIENRSSLAEILNECKNGSPALRFSVMLLVLLTALPANAALLWLMLKAGRAPTASELLGLNLLFRLSLPLNIYTLMGQRAGLLSRASNSFYILVYFSCPLLLTGMCVERYMAASHPVLFLQLGGWECRAVSSALVWMLTRSLGGVACMYDIPAMTLSLSLILNVLFFLMLACLLGIVSVLCRKGPGEGRTEETSDCPIKGRALKVVIAVLVPSTVTYMPLLALAPFLLGIQAAPHKVSRTLICSGIQLFSLLPGFGVCIGPMFYMSRARQLLCHRNDEVTALRENRTNS